MNKLEQFFEKAGDILNKAWQEIDNLDLFEDVDTSRTNRIEIIKESERSFVHWDDSHDIKFSMQDGGKTIKIFIIKKKPKP